MRTVHKYELPIIDYPSIMMPKGAVILKIDVVKMVDYEHIYIWAEVDTDAPMVLFNFRVFGTGHVIPPDLVRTYIDSVILSGGALVFHIYLT